MSRRAGFVAARGTAGLGRLTAFAAAALILVGATPAAAAPPRWTQLFPAGAPPAGRAAHSAVYGLKNRMIVFGGDATCVMQNDTWVLRNATGKKPAVWSQLSPAGTAPAPRYGHNAVYDPATNRMIVFGGDVGNACNGPNIPTNEVWVLTNANGLGGTPTWIQLAPTGPAPSGRALASAVYDSASNRLVLFAGNPAIGNCFGAVNDVWVLSNANGLGGTPEWTQLSPSGAPPPVREEHSAVYDPASNRMIVFGGTNPCGSPLADTWVLTNANGLGGTPAWIQLDTGAGPTARSGHSAVFNPKKNRMTVFGGTDFQGKNGETWMLSNANGLGGSAIWTQINAPGPPARSHHTAVLGAKGKMVVFGGYDAALKRLNDVWVLTGA